VAACALKMLIARAAPANSEAVFFITVSLFDYCVRVFTFERIPAYRIAKKLPIEITSDPIEDLNNQIRLYFSVSYNKIHRLFVLRNLK